MIFGGITLLSYPIMSSTFFLVLECRVSILQKSLFMGLDKCWAYISDMGFILFFYILLLYLFLDKCL